VSKFEGVDDVPEILTTEQADYVYALAKDIICDSLNAQLRDIVLLLGLPRRQEKALKNLIIAALSDYLHCYRQGIDLVTAEEDDNEAPEIVTHVDAVCPYCVEHFNSMVILTEDEKQDGVTVKCLLTETCPHCDKEMKVVNHSPCVDVNVRQEFIKIEEGVK